ncbi:hypothetical protein MLD38_036123 [Melastoma candidum]|uniref:Uncharacterized protein n=1 Tax=Melastoma candidum TaxID=119954 RepID=A0ACB9LIX4_9MYRT|nr:hypothetical protein MLD38_036123 [Melastoma candidum]
MGIVPDGVLNVTKFAEELSISSFDHSSIVSLKLFVALLCACIVMGQILEESRWKNESITALAIGLCTGTIILVTMGGKSLRLLMVSEDLFFIYLLPPVIFNAGFQVKKKRFFGNFMTIMLFSTFGTLISSGIISYGAIHILGRMKVSSLDVGDFLEIGAIFSATDSICMLLVLKQEETPLLHSLVFGEGMVNDATSVVLFNAIQHFDLTHINSSISLEFVRNFIYLFISSTMLGVLAGLLSVFIIKKLYFGRQSTNREVALMILMAYLSYMVAEVSTIFTVFFCGIVMSHYTCHNVIESSRVTTKHTFAALSFLAETFIFMYVGMDALGIEKWGIVKNSPGKSIGVSTILLVLVLLVRAAFVFPLSFFSNLTKHGKSERIGIKHQVTIWWAGLMRGAVSMALAYNLFTRSNEKSRDDALMITSTITVVLFSNLVFDFLAKPLVKILLPSPKHSSNVLVASEPPIPKSVTEPLLLGIEEDPEADQDPYKPTGLRMLPSTPSNTVHYYWRKFNDAVTRPVFGGRGFVPFVPISPTDPDNVHQWR